MGLYDKFCGVECCKNCRNFEGVTSKDVVICTEEQVQVKVGFDKISGDCFFFEPKTADILMDCNGCDKKFVCLLAK